MYIDDLKDISETVSPFTSAYHVVTRLNPDSSLTYIGYNTGKPIPGVPPLIQATVNPDGSLSESKEESAQKYLRQFLAYIKKTQSNMTEEEKEKTYLPYKELLDKFKELSPERFMALKKGHKDFSLIFNEKKGQKEKYPISVSLSVLTFNPKQNQFDLSVLVRNVETGNDLAVKTADLLKNLRKKNYFSDLKGSLLEAVDEQSARFLTLLCSMAGEQIYSYYTPYSIKITPEDFGQILYSLRGKQIFEKRKKAFKISDKIGDLNLAIDRDGKLSVLGKMPADMAFFGRFGAMIDTRSCSIDLYDLHNQTTADLLRFFKANPSFSPNDLSEREIESLFSRIEDSAKMDPEFKAKMGEKIGKIKLYVDFDEHDQLTFRTEIWIEGKQIKPSELDSYPLLKNKYQALQRISSELGFDFSTPITDSKEVYRFITSDLSALKKFCEIYLAPELSGRKKLTSRDIRIKVNYDSDWLNMDVESDTLSEQEIAKVLSAYRMKKKFIKLRDSVIMLDDEQLEAEAQLAETFDFEDPKEEIPLYKIFGLPENSSLFSFDVSPQIVKIVEDIRKFKSSKEKPADHFLKVMRSYQLDAYKWLRSLAEHRLGGILADDMGLGKTLETIAFMDSWELQKPILVVCPKSLIYNWLDEVQKWAPNLPIEVVSGNKAQRRETLLKIDPNLKKLYVVSYDSLRNDIDSFQKTEFGLIVLDEAQYIKNNKAKKTMAIKKLRGDQRFVLTGTPIENSVWDMWSIFDFLMPGYLLSEERFAHEYSGAADLSDQYSTQRLQAKVKPFILRRTKEEVLKDLPPLNEEIISVNMKDKQRKYYDSYLAQARTNAKANPKERIRILADLTRLRQICIDPGLFLEDYTDSGEKMNYSVELTQDAIENGHKVVIFSAFRSALDRIDSMFKEIGIKTYQIDGDTPAEDRIKIAKEFNKPEGIKVCLVSLKAGGTGLNLVGADIVIHLDPWWNIAAENQASDRTHRIGQTRPVTVYKLICKNSVEEKVLKLQDIKRELTETLISDSDRAISNLSSEDIKFLLS